MSTSSSVFFKKREGEKHYKSKLELARIFQTHLRCDAFFEVPSIENVEFQDTPVTYWFDVLLGLKGYRHYDYRALVILEVDGRIGHRTLKTDNKAKRRDDHFLQKYGIPTIRFATEDLVGSKKLEDSEIIDEFEFQYKGFEDSYKSFYCFVCGAFGFDKDYCSSCNTNMNFKITGTKGKKQMKNYQRKIISMPHEKRFTRCTWCDHSFHKHSFAGCSLCDHCITGIVHSCSKKDA